METAKQYFHSLSTLILVTNYTPLILEKNEGYNFLFSERWEQTELWIWYLEKDLRIQTQLVTTDGQLGDCWGEGGDLIVSRLEATKWKIRSTKCLLPSSTHANTELATLPHLQEPESLSCFKEPLLWQATGLLGTSPTSGPSERWWKSWYVETNRTDTHSSCRWESQRWSLPKAASISSVQWLISTVWTSANLTAHPLRAALKLRQLGDWYPAERAWGKWVAMPVNRKKVPHNSKSCLGYSEFKTNWDKFLRPCLGGGATKRIEVTAQR